MDMKMAVLSAALILSFLSGTGYAEPAKSEPTSSAATPSATAKTDAKSPATTPAVTGTPAAKPSNTSDMVAVSGKVAETYEAGSYTYFLMEKEGKKTWVAVPTYKAKVGDEISFRPGIQMGQFKSTVLNRTFDNIIFSAGPVLPEGVKSNDDFLMKRAHSKKPAAPAPPMAGSPEAKSVSPSPAKPEDKTSPSPELLSGKIVEKLDGGGYSFFLIEKDGKKVWVATPPTEGKVGDEVSFLPGMEMKEFKSKTLNKTFDSIIFSDGTAKGAKLDQEFLKKKAHEGLKKDAAQPVDQNGKLVDVKVEKAGGANGYTVAELYEKSGALNGKDVVVQGKVVKVSKQIMGKNWVHLQDGSGDPTAGTNNLVTTSQEIVIVGDVVKAQGKLAKDKDFGGGYQYTVILEETTYTKK